MATVKKQDDFDDEKHSGKRPNQKLKPYLVLQILMEHTDEEHVLCAAEIVDFLDEMGIYAERRSIYTDIDEMLFGARPESLMWAIISSSSFL